MLSLCVSFPLIGYKYCMIRDFLMLYVYLDQGMVHVSQMLLKFFLVKIVGYLAKERDPRTSSCPEKKKKTYIYI